MLFREIHNNILFSESYEAHKYTLWKKCTVFEP